MNTSPLPFQLLPVADVHVVMNAMNRLAARAMAQGRDEDPLLFALADYLRATLPASTKARMPVGQEVEALSALLALEQEIGNARIELRAQRAPAVTLPRGLLLAAATALLRARRPKSGGSWRLDLSWTQEGPRWVASLELHGDAAGAGCDGQAALALVQPALGSLGAAVGLGLVMDDGAHARLSLSLPPALLSALPA